MRSRLEVVSDDAGRCDLCPTRVACIAAQLSPEDRSCLPEVIRDGQPLQPGDHLVHAGDMAEITYHVRSGMFKTYVVNSDGAEFVTGFCMPGDIIGLASQAGRYTESAVALETSSACALAGSDLAARNLPGMVSGLMRQVGEQCARELRHQLNLRQSSSQARFSGYCLMMATNLRLLGRCPTHLPTPMSRTDIASYLGMTLESLSRVVSKMNAEGITKASRDHIEILQPERLAELGAHLDS